MSNDCSAAPEDLRPGLLAAFQKEWSLPFPDHRPVLKGSSSPVLHSCMNTRPDPVTSHVPQCHEACATLLLFPNVISSPFHPITAWLNDEGPWGELGLSFLFPGTRSSTRRVNGFSYSHWDETWFLQARRERQAWEILSQGRDLLVRASFPKLPPVLIWF